jgi:hypothetical protein
MHFNHIINMRAEKDKIVPTVFAFSLLIVQKKNTIEMTKAPGANEVLTSFICQR